MDSSRRAVESYWRSRMVDAVTSDEDKVAPVYKLEEICELLRSCHASIVKEVSDFILKKLEHKSPIVKQKALRLIKFAVGKSGANFRREMQRHSVSVRQLLHYKGQLDPLKGDAPNKAVRDMAQEAMSAIFSDENKTVAPTENLNKRIQGFGNTNYEPPTEDKKSFLSEVVGIGSASIKLGLGNLTQSNSVRNNDIGSYKSPNLRRSLTIESDYTDRYEPVELRHETHSSYGIKDVPSGPWGQESRITKAEMLNGDSGGSQAETKTREVRLLETIVTSGGVRLQPTRDAIQAFLVEAVKLNPAALSHALESKLQSPLWQVRLKAVCVLESILRRKDDEKFSIVASYFSENSDVVIRCSESPQSSLREKANKVLSLLGGEQARGIVSGAEKSVKVETAPAVQLPDLIDTGDQDDYNGTDNSTTKPSDQNVSNLTQPKTPLIDDLFGDSLGSGAGTSEQQTIDDDPFADVSFHTGEPKENVGDPFSGMTIDTKAADSGSTGGAVKSGPELFDIFGSTSETQKTDENQGKDVNNLMAGLSVDKNSPMSKQEGTSSGVSSDAFNNVLASQSVGTNPNQAFPLGNMPYAIPPGMMLNPNFSSQPINYGAMGSYLAQQQLFATMNLQQLANLNAQNVGISGHMVGTNGAYSSALPDVFQSSFQTQNPNSVTNGAKKEETRAFDFISEHLQAARDPKKLA